MARDRRWDHLYDRQKQPVKSFVVERFAEELARDLAAREPPLDEAAVRLALECARLDLAREWDALEARLAEERPRLAGGEASVRLLARELTERCLALKEWAEGARLARADLAEALRHAERRLFRVTL